MKSVDSQEIAASAPSVTEVLADPRFYVGRDSSEDVQAVEVVDHLEQGDRVTLKIRYAFTGELNAAARAILQPERLTWVQSSQHDLATGRIAFTILPDHYADRLRCNGRSVISTISENMTKRSVATELHVRAPLVANQVERALLDGLRRELEAQAEAIPRYVP